MDGKLGRTRSRARRPGGIPQGARAAARARAPAGGRKMSIAKPLGVGKKEEVKLDSAASHLLEECRMVLPGIQALFGFQLIAVFNNAFDEKLSPGEQQLHFLALFLVALAAGPVVGPAAPPRPRQGRGGGGRVSGGSPRVPPLRMCSP